MSAKDSFAQSMYHSEWVLGHDDFVLIVSPPCQTLPSIHLLHDHAHGLINGGVVGFTTPQGDWARIHSRKFEDQIIGSERAD